MPRLSEEQDRERVARMFEFDATASGSEVVLGIDEVGRGPVAGPLAAGGVVFDRSMYIKRLNDSKKISEKRRPVVASQIKELARWHSVVFIDPKRIDELGIANAIIEAFGSIISKCEEDGISATTILVDGNQIDLSDKRVKCIIKGDTKSASIAAASVVTKVERDDYMRDIAQEYPHFGWESNKGYGTASHMSAIGEMGLSPYHRKSFLTKFLQQ